MAGNIVYQVGGSNPKEMEEFHRRQAIRNKRAVPVDGIVNMRRGRFVLPEED